MWQSKLKGFTLIEIIVVVGVIALLTTVIMAGYSRTSQSYKMTLLADEFTSQVKALKSQVRSSTDALCRGVEIKDGTAKFIEARYLDPVRKCEDIPSKERVFDEELVIESLVVNGQRDAKQLTFYFVPPLAETVFPGSAGGNSAVEMVIGLNNSTRNRTIYFLPTTGTFSDVNPLSNE